jgi:hypothetical protein
MARNYPNKRKDPNATGENANPTPNAGQVQNSLLRGFITGAWCLLCFLWNHPAIVAPSTMFLWFAYSYLFSRGPDASNTSAVNEPLGEAVFPMINFAAWAECFHSHLCTRPTAAAKNLEYSLQSVNVPNVFLDVKTGEIIVNRNFCGSLMVKVTLKDETRSENKEMVVEVSRNGAFCTPTAPAPVKSNEVTYFGVAVTTILGNAAATNIPEAFWFLWKSSCDRRI